ncbi:MAG: hypothetical protein R3F46_15575 [bacterium]
MSVDGRIKLHPQIVTDAQGKPTAVQLSLDEFQRLLELIEDSADAECFRRALAEAEGYRSLDDVLAELAIS